MKSKKIVIIVYSGPHKPQMVKLKEWLEVNLVDYEYKLSSQFMLARKIAKWNPICIITYNKNLYTEKNVNAIINYCKQGGKLIALHHNISSMFMRRPEWLDFAGIKIVKGKEEKYPWSVIEGGDLYMFNLTQNHPITTKDIDYKSEAPEFELDLSTNKPTLTYELNENQKEKIVSMKKQPAIEFKKSEYFINHVPMPDPDRKLLFGLYFTDEKSGRVFFSANGGWITKKDKGTLIYLMPGHSSHDYNEAYCKIIRNSIEFNS